MSFRDQVIALAGMFQAAYLVQQIARQGKADSDAYENSVKSILKIDAQTTESVYEGLNGVKLGLEVLSTLYERENKQRDLEISQYVLGIAHLERKLARQPKLLEEIGNGIERAKSQVDVFSLTHENVMASLAGTYVDTISTIQPRIVVSGEQGYLSNPGNTNRVRVLLLSLMRSAVLWRQRGGRRWHLLFSRAKIMKMAKALLTECEQTPITIEQ